MQKPQYLTREQSQRIDRLATDRLGIPSIVLMENAGINATDIATGMLEATQGNKVAIICGGGNNGGDGFVIARHLHNAGRKVVVYLAADPASIKDDAAIHFEICQRINIKIMRVDDLQSLQEQSPHWSSADVLIDALLGTGYDSTRGLRPHAAAVINAINNASANKSNDASGPLVLAIDLPSGLDCDTGESADPTVRADATVTFVARKTGFDTASAAQVLGEIFLAGIGVPPALVDDAVHES